MREERKLFLRLTSDQLNALLNSDDVDIADVTFEEIGVINEDSSNQTILDQLFVAAGFEENPVNDDIIGGGQFAEEFAKKITKWLNTKAPGEQEAISSRLILQIAKEESHYILRAVRGGFLSPDRDSKELLKYHSRLSTALIASLRSSSEPHLKLLSKSFREKRNEMVATHLEREMKIRSHIRQRDTDKLKAQESHIEAIQTIRPGYFARNFTSWGKKAEETFQELITSIREEKYDKATSLMKLLLNQYSEQSNKFGKYNAFRGSIESKKSHFEKAHSSAIHLEECIGTISQGTLDKIDINTDISSSGKMLKAIRDQKVPCKKVVMGATKRHEFDQDSGYLVRRQNTTSMPNRSSLKKQDEESTPFEERKSSQTPKPL